MTYCVAIRLESGMLFASDSRTNAGVDHIATFCKMRVYEKRGDRVIVLLSSGNLAMTQGVVHLLDRQQHEPDHQRTIWSVPSLYDVAQIAGDALREMQRRDGPSLMQAGLDASANLIIGGQIAGEAPRLFHVYPQGNFIETSFETPYFQLGESKYGKPILDRVLTPTTTHREAAKCVLISFDSTIRSNISVGLPIDLLWYERDTFRVARQQKIRDGDPYWTMLRNGWGSGLRKVFGDMPNPDWLE
jgi:putative proteasome-type protease